MKKIITITKGTIDKLTIMKSLAGGYVVEDINGSKTYFNGREAADNALKSIKNEMMKDDHKSWDDCRTWNNLLRILGEPYLKINKQKESGGDPVKLEEMLRSNVLACLSGDLKWAKEALAAGLEMMDE